MIERYQRPEMKQLWSLENKFQKWLDIEIYACEAFADLGEIPEADVETIKSKASFDVNRILEIERETRHDVIAFTRAVSESLGSERKYIHYGLTSSDVVDTALSALTKDAVELVEGALDEVIEILKVQAQNYKYLPIMGRTHGVHAEPTTLGLKFALFYDEFQRNKDRLKRAKQAISVGKISGAVGSYANVAPEVEVHVCRRLGLTPALTSTQILQRDRHAELMSTLAIIAGSMDKLATEIRNLQKTEVREVEEPFYSGQKGSSAMPHKKNPINCEKISGLSRVIRGNCLTAFENQPLWHERDISHSSAERVIIPDSTTLAHYLLSLLHKVLRDLNVYENNISKNINATNGLVFSQRVLLAMIDQGLSREDAYDLVQEVAMTAWEEGESFHKLLSEDERVTRLLDEKQLSQCFDPEYYSRRVDYVFERLGI